MYAGKYLNKTEKWIVGICFAAIILNVVFLGANFYRTHLRIIPVKGGDYAEGAIGSVKYVNPLYSNASDIDSDLTKLVYSSLFKRNGKAELENDLAESYEISSDGKSYAVKIRQDAVWHNGSAVTADDVVFTFEAIKNIKYKSPLRAAFSGVEIFKDGDYAVKFNLSEPYAAFLDILNFGIMPQELWQQIEPSAASLADLNLRPIGSGAYKFKSFTKDRYGNIKTYVLARNERYYGQIAYINTISFKIFGNSQEAISSLNNNLVDGISYLAANDKNQIAASDSLNFYNLDFPKFSIVFFNQKSNPFLADKKTRQALAYAIDKNQIIEKAALGNAQAIDGPIRAESFAYFNEIKKYGYDIATSSRLLAEAGWKTVELTEQDIAKAGDELNSKDEVVKKQAEAKIKIGAGKWLAKNNDFLAVKLDTSDNPEYAVAAELIAKFWNSMGVKTEINIMPAGQFHSDIIKPRNFQALIYGEMAGADPDPYVFWHSSQIGHLGLNIAGYANKEIDKLLEEGRMNSDIKIRAEKYKKFQEIMVEDEPAIFLYSNNYIYVQSKKIKGFNIKSIVSPSDRLESANQWHIKTGKKIVW